MKMADNHIRLESSPWPDPLSQANLRVETNGRGRRRGRRMVEEIAGAGGWAYCSSILHLRYFRSFHLSTSSPLPPFSLLPFVRLHLSLFAFFLVFSPSPPLSLSLWSIYPYALCSPLSRVFPNSILNLNHDLTVLPHCVRYSQVKLHDRERAVTANCLIIIQKDPRVVPVESVKLRNAIVT